MSIFFIALSFTLAPMTTFRVLLAALFVGGTCSSLLADQQFGLFSCRTDGMTAEITEYPTTESGDPVIPAEFNGIPFTRIGDSRDK